MNSSHSLVFAICLLGAIEGRADEANDQLQQALAAAKMANALQLDLQRPVDARITQLRLLICLK